MSTADKMMDRNGPRIDRNVQRSERAGGMTPKAFYATKEVLLGIAGLVWCAAGFNIVRIGMQAYAEQSGALLVAGLLVGSVAVFLVFWTRIFSKLLGKHTDRIVGYGDQRQPFWRFFDRQAFIIMAVMMTMGISLRAFSLVPSWFIASFYTGLGVALFGAGAGFLVNLVRLLKASRGAGTLA